MPSGSVKATLPLMLRGDGDRQEVSAIVLIALGGLFLLVCLASLAVGPVPIPLSEVLLILIGTESGQSAVSASELVVRDIRAPRTVMGALVGAALAASGATLQSLFRNPLADPGLVGVSAGAALAAVTVIVLGVPPILLNTGITTFELLPPAAFIGGLLTTVLLYAIATRQGRTSTATMLLAGIAIAALASALTGVLVFISTDQQLRDLTFWSLGSLAGATWYKCAAIVAFIFPALLMSRFVANGLNGLLLGESQALHIGIQVQRTKILAVLLVALAVGASVAVSGIIGFVGIVVPHILRLIIGPDNRFLLPACMLLGAVLLLSADMIARVVVAPAELPIGIVTAVLGGPFFLWLLLRQRGLVDV